MADGITSLSSLSWGTSSAGSAVSAETTLSMGVDRVDIRTPPNTSYAWGAQINACKNLLISISQTFKSGTRLGVSTQTSNPFGATESGFYIDTSGGFWGVFNGTPTALTGGGGGTGNWTFSGNAADLNAANAMTIAATTAASLSLGRSGINILLPGGVIRASTAAANTAGVAFTFGLNNGGAAGTGSAAGAGGANTWTSGQGGAATTTAGETAAAGGGTVIQGGQGGTGAASTNGPAAGGTAIIRGGAAGTVTSGFSGANGGDCILRGGALSGTGTNGNVVLGDSNTAAIKLSNTVVNFATNGVWSALTQGATNTTGLTISSNVADGASTVGIQFKANTAQATAGAKLYSWMNGATEVMYYDTPNNLIRFSNGGGISDGSATAQLVCSSGNAYFFGNTLYPFTTDNSPLGAAANRWKSVYSGWYDVKLGAQLTAAATITPTSGLHHVTGATSITTIATTNLPSSGNVYISFIADGGTITFATGGNIAVGATIAVNSMRTFVWDNSAAKWYPHN